MFRRFADRAYALAFIMLACFVASIALAVLYTGNWPHLADTMTIAAILFAVAFCVCAAAAIAGDIIPPPELEALTFRERVIVRRSWDEAHRSRGETPFPRRR